MTIDQHAATRRQRQAGRLLYLAAGLALATFAPNALAQATECQMTLSQPELDFGQQGRMGAERSLGSRALTISVLCNTPGDLSLFYRAGAADGKHYDFTEQGRYSMRVRDAQVDGQQVDLGRVTAGGQAPVDVAVEQPWLPGQGLMPMHGGAAVHGRSLTARIEVSASVQQGLFSVHDATTWQVGGQIDLPARAISRDLALTTRFTPGSCTPSLANNGVVALGALRADQLDPDRGTRLPVRDIALTVQCDAPTLFALSMKDNRGGTSTVNNPYAYGMGLDGADNRIGTYYVHLDPARTSADAMTTVYRTESFNGGTGWSNSSSDEVLLASIAYVGFTDLAGSNAGPTPIQSLSSVLSVDATIAATRDLEIRDVITIDGMATVEIIYL